jgi:glycosyltransferase involved in cell wall biosynthesis
VVKYRLAIIVTHPIQYQVPWIQQLAAHPDVDPLVLYAHIPSPRQQGIEFGVPFRWDIPLLEGYAYEVMENRASNPGTGHYAGCDVPGIRARLAQDHFDAVLVNGWNSRYYLQTSAACRRLGIPCLVRGESNALRPRTWWKRILHRHILRRFDAFLVIGKSNADFYRHNGISEEQLFPARYCVDNERFAAQAEQVRPQRHALRRQWDIPAEKVVLLLCGKLIAKKRPMDFLHAFESANRQGLPVHGLVVGDGELKSSCEEFALARNLPVTFAGFLNQTELPGAYVAADCLVLPSDFGETWGLVVNEAMACGRCAVVSDRVGSGPDLIVEGRTGRTFPFGNVKALADALVELGRAPDALSRMGDAAREHVRSYSMANAVQGTLAALRFVCPAPGRRRSLTRRLLACRFPPPERPLWEQR